MAPRNYPPWVHININLTITDNEGDINLMPDGSIPTMLDKSKDAISNTSTHHLYNSVARQWQVITIRHAPFGMPISQQRGEKWWLAPPNPALVTIYEQEHANLRRSMNDLRRAVNIEARRADVLTELARNEAEMASVAAQMARLEEEMAALEKAAREQAALEQAARERATALEKTALEQTEEEDDAASTTNSSLSEDSDDSNDSDDIYYDSEDSAVAGLGL